MPTELTNEQVLQSVAELFSDYLKFLSERSVTAATFAKPNLERLHSLVRERMITPTPVPAE